MPYKLTRTKAKQIKTIMYDTLSPAADYIRNHAASHECAEYHLECSTLTGDATVLTASVNSDHAVISYDWREIERAGGIG